MHLPACDLVRGPTRELEPPTAALQVGRSIPISSWPGVLSLASAILRARLRVGTRTSPPVCPAPLRSGGAILWPASASARHAATVPPHHAQAEPDKRANHRHGESKQPDRPGEAPEQEVDPDGLGVLDDDDDEQPDAGERGDGPAAEPLPLSCRRRVLVAGIRLDHK